MALAGTLVWEIRTDGSDSNSGGFRPGVGGTDRSQQTNVQVAIDNATITCTTPGANSNTLTFTAGYVPSAADVGNTVQMLTGTNINAGIYEITNQSATTWTLTGAQNLTTAGGAGSAITGNMGGCHASPGKTIGFAVAGNQVWLKFGTYSITTTSANVAAGRLNITVGDSGGVAFRLQGYDLVRGDYTANRPTIQAGTNTMVLITANANEVQIYNLIVDAASATGIDGINASGGGVLVYNCRANKCNNSYGFSLGGTNTNALLCEALNGTAINAYAGGNGNVLFCVAKGWSGTALYSIPSGGMIFCLATGCSPSGQSFKQIAGVKGGFLYGCVSYNNTAGNAFDLQGGGGLPAINCIAWGHSGVGANGFVGATTPQQLFSCAAGNNAGSNFTALTVTGINNITLTGDPFVNGTGGDFQLNNIAGAGALLRSLGFPQAFPPGISSATYPDIGLTQHNIPAGAQRVLLRLFGVRR